MSGAQTVLFAKHMVAAARLYPLTSRLRFTGYTTLVTSVSHSPRTLGMGPPKPFSASASRRQVKQYSGTDGSTPRLLEPQFSGEKSKTQIKHSRVDLPIESDSETELKQVYPNDYIDALVSEAMELHAAGRDVLVSVQLPLRSQLLAVDSAGAEAAAATSAATSPVAPAPPPHGLTAELLAPLLPADVARYLRGIFEQLLWDSGVTMPQGRRLTITESHTPRVPCFITESYGDLSPNISSRV